MRFCLYKYGKNVEIFHMDEFIKQEVSGGMKEILFAVYKSPKV